jgi:hypothetical protein
MKPSLTLRDWGSDCRTKGTGSQAAEKRNSDGRKLMYGLPPLHRSSRITRPLGPCTLVSLIPHKDGAALMAKINVQSLSLFQSKDEPEGEGD